MALLSLIQTGGGSGSSSSIWNNLQNATGNLTLSNTGYATTFDQTSAVAWTWANTTAATVSTSPAALVASGVSVNGTPAVTITTTGATLLVAVLSGQGALATISDSVGGNSNAWNYITGAADPLIADGNYTRI